jgi:hypothetical protein
MKCKDTVAAAVVLIAGLAVMADAGPARASTLDFNGDICGGACGNGYAIDSNYGSTATVSVSYNDGNGNPYLYFWGPQYSNLTNVAYGYDASVTAEIFLTPHAGYSVTLSSLDLGAWPNTDRTSQLTVVNGSNSVLYSSGAITISGTTASHFLLNLTSSNGIGIEFGPNAYDVGIDNVVFSANLTATPLPAALPLFAGGLGILGLVGARRKRRQQAA